MYLSSPSRPRGGGGAIAKRFYPSNLFSLTTHDRTFDYSVSAMTYDIEGQTVAVISGYASRPNLDPQDVDIILPSGIRPSVEQTIVVYTTDGHGVAPDTSGSPDIVTIGTSSFKLSDLFNRISDALSVQFEGCTLLIDTTPATLSALSNMGGGTYEYMTFSGSFKVSMKDDVHASSAISYDFKYKMRFAVGGGMLYAFTKNTSDDPSGLKGYNHVDSTYTGTVGTLPERFIPITVGMLDAKATFETGIPSVRFTIDGSGQVRLVQGKTDTWMSTVLGKSGMSDAIPSGLLVEASV